MKNSTFFALIGLLTLMPLSLLLACRFSGWLVLVFFASMFLFAHVMGVVLKNASKNQDHDKN